MAAMRWFGIFAGLLLLLPPLMAVARPVSYADGWMFMQMNDHMEHAAVLHYSPTAYYAVGLRSEYQREDEDWVHTLVYNRLLQRWNAADSQGNLYLQSGLGMAEHAGDIEPAASVGLEADWESRRLYVAYENRYLYAGEVEKSFAHKVRFGFAPYLAGYDDLNTWLMVQVDHHPAGRDNVVVTPFVRLFTAEALGEFGVSNHKDVMLNLTLQF